MPEPRTFEARVAAAYERWAAEMPVDIDAMALVRGTRRASAARGGLPWVARPLAAAALLAVLLALLVGTFVLVGSQPRRSSESYEGVFSQTGSLVRCFGYGLLESFGRPRARFSPTLLMDGRVLVYPQVFDPATDTLATMGSLDCSDALTVGLEDGGVLVVGAIGGSGVETAGAALLDPGTGEVRDLQTPGEAILTATRLEDGRVLLLGSSSAAIYEPGTAAIEELGAMSRPADLRSSTLLEDGRVLVASARVGSAARAEAWAQLFDPATDTFAPTGAPLEPQRDVTSAVRLDDGSVLFVGGSEPLGRRALATAELYDPVEGAFRFVGPMGSPRYGAATAVLADGRVLVTGGLLSPRDRIGGTLRTLASAELYDPATRRFEPTGSMALERSGHAAVPLVDGRVLIVGGGADTEAELYR